MSPTHSLSEKSCCGSCYWAPSLNDDVANFPFPGRNHKTTYCEKKLQEDAWTSRVLELYLPRE